MKRPVRILLVLVVAVSACGAQGPHAQGHDLDGQVLAAYGPRINDGAILAATDLTTLRALVDADAQESVRELGGRQPAHECQPPYAFGGDFCWPGETSHAGRAYIAMYIGGGFCQRRDSTGVSVQARHIQVQIDYSQVSDCHINGVVALPAAALISFSTTGLQPGLYSVSYVINADGDTYRSESTYLSLPSPEPGDQSQMEAEAAAATGSVIATQRGSVFSISRVDGMQLHDLCAVSVNRPVYLVTYASAPAGGPRSMTVVLAGDPPRTCRVSRI